MPPQIFCREFLQKIFLGKRREFLQKIFLGFLGGAAGFFGVRVFAAGWGASFCRGFF